ncbi:hypothetical protein AXF14_03225 [Actinomyces radicidentis]|uniref:Uncharacterized protein n=1 Tax=Actinomyces radicidentis TaxID=111015 RepID=A0A0X8JDB8_ACTRD|nr:hypothetical protein [Actinomyces radicidentis]AMD86790.1 hypothetical protein AXF14_03225 [Actinomyces radicidentis]
MGVIDAPQWLLPAYVRSVKSLGATAPVEDLRAAGERLIEMWGSPDRRFHNLRHAIDMLARVDELADESHNPDIMRLAVWYHGCIFSSSSEEIYRRNGGEDEVASAAYAAEDLHGLGVPDKVVDRVCALILNLKRHNLAPNDIDALALNDADLGTLAVEPQQYKKYREQVRAEYAHIPAEDYLRARLTIIGKLLGRETLFSSPLGARWELPARENLEAEKRRVEAELEKLPHDPNAPTTAADVVAKHLDARIAEASAEGEKQAARRAVAASATLGGLEAADAPEAAEPRPATRPAPVITPTAAARKTSVASPATPATGVSSVGPQARPEPKDESAGHTTTMESCIEDLDRLLSSPRAVDAVAATEGGLDRASLAQAERDKMCERLRAKAEEAKVLREARTGEFSPISAEVIDDGQGGA